jgi:flavin-dependent dehydrogenase
MRKIQSVAIIGGGPAGAALATHLRRAGKTVAIFDTGRRPELVVGESLVPALIPLLQELGVEEEIAAVSTYKPGATFYTAPDKEVSFLFAQAGRRSPNYAYNVPRADFDAIVLQNAARHGAHIIPKLAHLSLAAGSSRISLAPKSLDAWREATGSDQPDLVVDASGRSRTIAKLLKLPGWEGSRKDIAIFAHLRTTETSYEGHIHINRLKRGWSWRIPLPGCVSVGVVISRDALKDYGDTAEEQYERLCREEPILSAYTRGAQRVTPVMKYTNYQMASHVWTDPSWALLGDAGGFIDPIFSSGLLLALEGASELAQAITKGWDRHAKRYEKTMRVKLSAWRSLIESFYDGRIFSLFRLRGIYAESRLVSLISRRVNQQLALALSGTAPTSRRRLWLLNLLLTYLRRSRGNSRVRIA